jgi:hypothetical protein
MADVASKQQTTALFLSTIVTRTKRHTELTEKKMTNLMENLLSSSCRFFSPTVKLHSLTWGVWGPLLSSRTCTYEEIPSQFLARADIREVGDLFIYLYYQYLR